MRVQVVVVGAGPAGLFLGHLLHAAGIDCLILERHDRAYVEGRVRAGVLERTTVSLMETLGVAERMRAEGLVHGGASLAIDGDLFRIDFEELTGGSVMVYGQQEVVRDLFEAAEARGLNIVFGASDVALHDLASNAPFVTWSCDGKTHRATCDLVAGCDGFHGISRQSVPGEAFRAFERVYPFGWLGILVDEPPCDDELIYSNHENGFALASMRSATRSRYYIQCSQDAAVEDWPDERFWDELCIRLGPGPAARVRKGPSFEKTIAPLRSLVTEPMRYGRLFLAGDAAHIVPPTGAKGMNLAVSDVIMLAEAVVEHYRSASDEKLDRYSPRALARVWKAERFSWWFTGLTHRFPDASPFDRRLQLAELSYLKSSRAAQTAFAENYVGLPIEPHP